MSFLMNERGPADWELWQRSTESQDGWEPHSQAVVVTAKSATEALSAAPPLPNGFEWRAVSILRMPVITSWRSQPLEVPATVELSSHPARLPTVSAPA
jgi:hypothetical protein